MDFGLIILISLLFGIFGLLFGFVAALGAVYLPVDYGPAAVRRSIAVIGFGFIASAVWLHWNIYTYDDIPYVVGTLTLLFGYSLLSWLLYAEIGPEAAAIMSLCQKFEGDDGNLFAALDTDGNDSISMRDLARSYKTVVGSYLTHREYVALKANFRSFGHALDSYDSVYEISRADLNGICSRMFEKHKAWL